MRGLPNSIESTMGRSGLPPHSQMSQGGVASIGASPWGLPHPWGANVEAGLPRKARVSREWPWVS